MYLLIVCASARFPPQVSLKGSWWTLTRLRKAVQGLINEEPGDGVKQVMLMAICEDPTNKKQEETEADTMWDADSSRHPRRHATI